MAVGGMDDRKCEKCEGLVPRGIGLCSDCGWENDLKYYVRTTPAPVPTVDEIKSEKERENWYLVLPASMIGSTVLLMLTIAGLCSYWAEEARLLFSLAAISVFAHCLLLGTLSWIASSNEESIVQGEGGYLYFWAKALTATIVAHVVFLFQIAPMEQFNTYINDAFAFYPVYAIGWSMYFVAISASGWFAAVKFFFSHNVIWSGTLVAMILAIDASAAGFATWWFTPLQFPILDYIQTVY